jgi:epoxyqueuosine reductase
MDIISEMLQSEFGKIHAKFKTVSIIHLQDLQKELTTWQQDGMISKKFYEQNYGQFVFHSPTTLPKARSIIVIGIPQKVTRIEFFNNGKRYQTIIPPTYIFSQVRSTCKEILSKTLKSKGYSAERAIIPMKLLAAKSGLGKYGKNNLCYVDGMGSYTRLEAFYTDYEFSTDDWCEKQLMKACTSCSLCRHACPTHCIPSDRILIHADQCLTYFNENLGDFPASIPKQSHNALIGCMHCQIVCPENKKYFAYNQETITFTEEEISRILHNTPRESIPQNLAKKLNDLNLYEDYPELPRNFTVLIDKKNTEDHFEQDP